MSANRSSISGSPAAVDAAVDEAMPAGLPPIGTVLAGKYRLDSILGLGGMGAVYRARHEMLNAAVAVKVILPEFASRSEFVMRFTNEAKAAARIESDHITRVSDVGTTADGISYLVMELLEGEDLGNILAREGPQPVERAVHWVLEAIVGLNDAHSAGVVHRDLKPANLFLTRRAGRSDRVKICDFGISKATFDDSVGITKTNALLGSPAYMAPEQLRSSRNVDKRADIWSLGVILYELITGATPFSGDNVGAVFAAILETDPMPLRAMLPEVPEEVDAAVLRCLRRRLDERFADVTELAIALGGEDYLRRRSQRPPGDTPSSRDSLVARRTPTGARSGSHTPRRNTSNATERFTPPAGSSSTALGSMGTVASTTGPQRVGTADDARTTGAAVVSVADSRTDEKPTLSSRVAAPAKRQRIVAAGVGVAAVLALGTVAVMKLGTHGPAPIATTAAATATATPSSLQPSTPSLPSTVRVKLTVAPALATVSIDDVPLVAPYDKTVPSDTRQHVVRVEATGFEPHVETVRFDGDVALVVTLAPLAPAAKNGRHVAPTTTTTTARPTTPTTPSTATAAAPTNPEPAPPVTAAPLPTTKAPKPDIDDGDPWGTKKK